MICRILFVDDEPKMLRGLRRMLMHLQDDWQMHFAQSGNEALDVLASEPFDILVTDLKMLGMDGNELLDQVRKRHPEVIRLVLSGYSNKPQILRSVKLAHQFLSKPSSPEIIQNTVERVLPLKNVLRNMSMRSAISRLQSLPVLPATHAALLRWARENNGTLDDLSGLVRQDMALAAMMFKMVNTSFFGESLLVSDPARAVALLGSDTLRELVLQQDLFFAYDATRYPEFTLDRLWGHSRRTSLYAEEICRMEGGGKEIVQHASMAGLLHDIGKIVLAQEFEETFSAFLARAQEDNITFGQAEEQMHDVSHDAMGAYLLGLWGFPPHVIQAVSCHHAPGRCDESLHVSAVHAANVLDHDIVVLNKGYASHLLDADYLEQQGLGQRYETWRDALQNLEGER